MVRIRVASFALAALLWGGGGEVVSAETITLEKALERAQQHPDVLDAKFRIEAALGRRKQAGTFLYNPEISADVGPRFGGSQTVLDYGLSVSQTLELGGKRGFRRSAAEAKLGATQERRAWTRARVALRVRHSFAVALSAKDVLDTTVEAESLAIELKATSDERLSRGAGNLLEVNLAAAGVGRARRRRSKAEQALIAAEYELATAVGGDAKTRLVPVAATRSSPALSVEVKALLSRALASRTDQRALKFEVAASESEVLLADALATPDLSVGASYVREEGTDQVLATVSIQLPLWNRNRGGQEEARARRRRAKLSVRYGQQEMRREVRAAIASYQTARSTVEAFDRDAVAKLADTLALTREAFERGKISMLEFNLLRTEFVEVRLAYLDAVAEEIHARFQLERAVGERLP